MPPAKVGQSPNATRIGRVGDADGAVKGEIAHADFGDFAIKEQAARAAGLRLRGAQFP